jgi:hypothetical protein
MSHLQHPASTWLLPRIWWAGSLLSLRGKPRLGGLSIDQTVKRRDAVSDVLHKRAAETKRARKTAQS